MTRPVRRVLPVTPRLAARARADQRARRRRLLRRGSCAALALAPVLLLSWLLLASPLLSVHTVQVVGTGRLAAPDVRVAAGVRAGVPLAGLDTAAVRSRVAALPDVARVRVVRAWPRTLRLVVTERAPVAAVHRSDGSWSLLDGSGAAFAPSTDRPADLPELQAAGTDPVPEAGLRVLAELAPPLRRQVATVRTPSPSSVVLVLRDGRSVVWGGPGQAARKAAVVAALLPRPGATIDVTSPGVAVVRAAPTG